MDFGWGAETQALYERTRRFACDELGHSLSEREPNRQFGWSEWRKCAEHGLMGLPISREYGGQGHDCLTTARVLEAFGAGCADGGLGFALGAHLLACCVPIDRYGTDEQKRAYLPKLCSGEWIGANAITEEQAGSDAFALHTRAVADGEAYRLTGEKVIVTNAPVAEVLLVYASTRPELGVFGVSAFLVRRDTLGMTIGEPMDSGGLKTTQIGSVTFDDCRIPACQRLGAEGAGVGIFQDSMGWERSCLFAFWVGTMDRQLDEVIRYAQTRHQFGRPIGANQAVSHRIADMKLRLESARLLLYRACWERAQGLPSTLSTSLSKLAISEAFVQSSIEAAHLFGARGVMREAGMERYVRDALPGTIYSGTSEMHRELIVQALGLSSPRPRREPAS